jgi:hypothetical protein
LVGGGVCDWIFVGVAGFCEAKFAAEPLKKFRNKKWEDFCFFGGFLGGRSFHSDIIRHR